MTTLLESLRLYLDRGGLVAVPLALAACLLWYGLGYRLLTLRRGSLRSARVLIERYLSGARRPPRGVVDGAVVLALQTARQGRQRLRPRLDEALGPLQERLARFQAVTRLIVVIAPLCGLLGTVMGMVETFDSLAEMSLFAQSGGVAGGISQALFSTQLGLAVAVPGLVVGQVLSRRQELLEQELDRIKDIVCTLPQEVLS